MAGRSRYGGTGPTTVSRLATTTGARLLPRSIPPTPRLCCGRTTRWRRTGSTVKRAVPRAAAQSPRCGACPPPLTAVQVALRADPSAASPRDERGEAVPRIVARCVGFASPRMRGAADGRSHGERSSVRGGYACRCGACRRPSLRSSSRFAPTRPLPLPVKNGERRCPALSPVVWASPLPACGERQKTDRMARGRR